MLALQHEVALDTYNTFGIAAKAQSFYTLEQYQDLALLSELYRADNPFRILGSGSNILLQKDVEQTVIHNKLMGKTLVKEDAEHIWVDVAAGELWHEWVLYAIANNWAGIENLALIPGTVGAAPIQNIGAYGVEVKDYIEQVFFWNWKTGQEEVLSNAECRFGYRNSIFKQSLKDSFLITKVRFKLNKKPVFKTEYGAIKEELARQGCTELNIKAIAHAVIAIRSSKLPDPKQVGNAGSFFKNPVIDEAHFLKLRAANPHIVFYPEAGNHYKIPAAWLIEQCGWKGFREGNYGVHPRQALVLVNYGGASGKDIWQLSDSIINDVRARFDIELEREVQVW